MPEVTFWPDRRYVQIEPGQNLLEASRKLSSSGEACIEAPCGGKGSCGRCRVLVRGGHLEPPAEPEKDFLSAAELAAGWRLACLAVPLGPVQIEIPPESMTLRPELQLAGEELPVKPDPPVTRRAVQLSLTTIEHPVSVWQQIERALATGGGLPPPAVDPDLIRRHDPKAEGGTCIVSLTGNEITNLYRRTPAPPPVGLAVDLGTTKVAGYLVSLETGSVLAAAGVKNPQTQYGADVVSRLAYAAQSPAQAGRLTRLASECINSLADVLTRRQGLEIRDIEQIVVAGNTVMHHLLLAWPVAQLGHAPYVPASTAPVELKGREVGLDCAPGALLYMVPPIAGYVGGDHTAMILACRIHEAPGVTLGLDIGTNTEIVLADRGELSSCSCASGPAFEGAHISQGVRAVEGAVYKVRLGENGSVACQTIGDKPPVGLCGSGVVDAVAELVRHGIVNELGILSRAHPRVRIGGQEGAPEFVLASASESGARSDLVLTQKDVCAIQLAKAAIAAGVAALLSSAGITLAEIEQVHLAGAFGTRVEPDSAIALGLLPDLPRERFRQVGNAAGTGSRLVLVSAEQRRTAEQLARRVRYLELGAHPGFGKFFADALRFPRPERETAPPTHP